MRLATNYSTVRDANGRWRKCGHCRRLDRWAHRVCRGCGRRFLKPKRAVKPKAGTPERLARDLAHAGQMADRWTTKVKAAVNTLHKWSRKERELAKRLAAGPQPKRPPKPKPPARGIRFEARTPILDVAGATELGQLTRVGF